MTFTIETGRRQGLIMIFIPQNYRFSYKGLITPLRLLCNTSTVYHQTTLTVDSPTVVRHNSFKLRPLSCSNMVVVDTVECSLIPSSRPIDNFSSFFNTFDFSESSWIYRTIQPITTVYNSSGGNISSIVLRIWKKKKKISFPLLDSIRSLFRHRGHCVGG